MSILIEYERDEWEAQGGWRGVPQYTDAVTLLFRDDYEIDELEESAAVRTETPIEHRDAVLVRVTRRRAYRSFDRVGDEWWLVEQGVRDFTDSIVVGGMPTESEASR